jgi:predicted PurR-regulated permease PerM
MEPSDPQLSDNKAFVVLVVLVSIAFVAILWPFWVAVFWATVLAIVFSPVNRRIQRSIKDRRSLAATCTVILVVFMVLLPSALVGAMVLQEAAVLVQSMQSGDMDPARLFERVFDLVPAWAATRLHEMGLADLEGLQQRLSAGFSKGAQVVGTQALNLGQNTFDFVVGAFVMLYILFFLLRDGRLLAARIRDAIPLEPGLRDRLTSRFIKVVRATVKGNVVVAVIQGALGGLAFWVLGIEPVFLWAVLMTLLSLLPAVGCAIVWLPVALYLLFSGSMWQGIGLIAYGTIVIGLADNILRPLLVGKDTKMPDYVILVTTLGGMALFGLNGFVIGPLVAAMFLAVWDTVASARVENGAT